MLLVLLGVGVSVAISGRCIADEDFRIEGVRGGFLPFLQPGAWQQCTFSVANSGSRSRAVKVGCLADDAQQGRVRYTRIVTVPPRCRRKIRLAYRPGKLPHVSGRNTQGTPHVEQFFQLWDATTGSQLTQMSGMGIELAPNATAIVRIGADLIPYDDYQYIETMQDHLFGEVHFLSGHVAALPTRWYGYSMADMVLLGGVDVASIRETQWRALLQWVRRGGVLVLTGSRSLPEMLAGRMGVAAGVCGLGVHTVDRLTVTGEKFTEQTVRLQWPMPMVELCPLDAEVLYEANGLPLLTRRKLGKGTIFTLAVSTGGLTPQPLHSLWYQVVRSLRSDSPVNDSAFLRPGRRTLQQIEGRRSVTGIVPASIMLALMVLVVIGGALLRLRRRGELVWLTLIPLAIVLGIVLYLIGIGTSRPERLGHIGLISDIGNGQVRVQEAYAYHTGSDSRSVTFTAGRADGVIRDIGQAVTAAVTVSEVRTTDESMELPDQMMQPNSSRILFADSVVATQGLKMALTFDETGLVGQIDNCLGADITDTVLYVNHRTYRMDDLPADKQARIQVGDYDLLGAVSFPQPERTAKNKRTSKAKNNKIRKARRQERAKQKKTKRKVIGPVKPRPIPPAVGEFTCRAVRDRKRNELVGSLLARPSLIHDVSTRPVLIGYTEAGLIRPLGGRTVPRQGWSVVIWPIEFQAPPAGTRVAIPAGLVTRKLRNVMSPVWNSWSKQFYPTSRLSELLVLVRPPSPISALKDTTATLTVGIQASGWKLRISGAKHDAAGKVTLRSEIKSITNPSGNFTITIPQADRFLDADGWYVFSLQVQRLGAPAVKPSAGQATSWSFKSVDISLKGIVR